jgi:hypothetical protein
MCMGVYLLGHKFRLITDNRAVFLIFRNPLSKPPARILRWDLRLRSFNFEVKHRPGIGNIADFLSRHPMNIGDMDAVETEHYINSIVTYAVPKRVNESELLDSTLKDPALSKLSEMVKTGRFDKQDEDVRGFAKVFNELTITGEGLALRNDKLFIPSGLKEKIVNLAHEAHLGMVRIKRLIRSMVWFPGINQMVESKVKHCMACQATDPSGTGLRPMEMSPMPKAPWVNLSIDFFGFPTSAYYSSVATSKWHG